MPENYGPGPDGPANDNWGSDPRPDRGDDQIKPWTRWHPVGIKR